MKCLTAYGNGADKIERDGIMPVELFDGQVYTIDAEIDAIDREDVLQFFLNKHMYDILALYDELGNYKGIISFKGLIQNNDLISAIVCEKLCINCNFWEEARNVFGESCDDDKIVPVFSNDMRMIYLAKNSPKLAVRWQKLCELQAHIDQITWKGFKQYVHAIHIKGINDLLFDLREWMVSLGTEVSVEGEAWEFFGIKESKNVKKTLTVDHECRWIDSLYIEYCNWRDNYSTGLKNILTKPYVGGVIKRETVLFYLPETSYFVESIIPLIFRYTCSEMEVIITFPNMQKIIGLGCENVKKMKEVIEKLENNGAKCFSVEEKELYQKKYSICFLLSEYSGKLPSALRNLSCMVVAIQATALYTHMYFHADKFDEVFSEQAREEIDYLIASDYIADWICERNRKWSGKVLRLGYPKLDALYNNLKQKPYIPSDWLEKTVGKKVILFTTYMLEQSWLDAFANMEWRRNVAIIWRPHPGAMCIADKRKRIIEIGEKYDIIIDDMLSYYASFWLSSALVSGSYTSVMVNYLYTEKPVCIYDSTEMYARAVIDYRKEIWYKCAYVTYVEGEVLKFIDMVKYENNFEDRQSMVYRADMLKHFDGKVCDRIYNCLKGINKELACLR